MKRGWKHCLWGVLVAVMLISAGILLSTPGTGNTANSEKNKPQELSGNLDIILIDNPGYKEVRKGPVKFKHLAHARDYGPSCWDCHHVFTGAKNVYVPWGPTPTQKCSACHDPLVRKGSKTINLQKAYHLTCRNCHKKRLSEHKIAGPYIGCSGCHEKKPGLSWPK